MTIVKPKQNNSIWQITTNTNIRNELIRTQIIAQLPDWCKKLSCLLRFLCVCCTTNRQYSYLRQLKSAVLNWIHLAAPIFFWSFWINWTLFLWLLLSFHSRFNAINNILFLIAARLLSIFPLSLLIPKWRNKVFQTTVFACLIFSMTGLDWVAGV